MLSITQWYVPSAPRDLTFSSGQGHPQPQSTGMRAQTHKHIQTHSAHTNKYTDKHRRSEEKCNKAVKIKSSLFLNHDAMVDLEP